MQSIWYRHWLELRRLMLLVCVLTLPAALGYGFAVTGAAGYFAKTGRLTQEVARYEAMRQMIPEPHLVPWAIHTLIVSFFALFVSGMFQGTGLGEGYGVRGIGRRHSSAYFTASLPLSRERIVGSRLAIAVASLAAVLAVSLIVHWLTLLVIGQPIPIIVMARTSLMGVVFGFGLIAIGAFLTLAVSETLGGLAIFAMTMGLWLSQDGWNATVEFIGGSSVRALAAVIGTSLLLIASALLFVRRKEL